MTTSQSTQYTTSTFLGGFGMLTWATTGCIASQLARIPPFEFLALTALVNLLSSCFQLTYYKKWSSLKQPLFFWAIGCLCVPMNTLGYFWSFQYINPALADLIYYMYPVQVLLLASIFSKGSSFWKSIIGAFISFLGVCVLLYQDLNSLGSPSVWEGVFFGFLGSFSWAAYSLATKFYSNAPFQMIGIFFGVGSIFSFGIHLATEVYVPPSFLEWAFIVFWGLIVQSLSINLWEKGLRFGNFGFLNGLSFTIPIVSIFLLVLTGFTPLSYELLIATALVTLGLSLNYKDIEVFENKPA